MNSGSPYITLGYNFLQLSINAIDEMEKQGNHVAIITSGASDDDESWDNYHEKTRWNDNNIALPVLFNFYHGIELILKGLILICEGDLPNTGKHSLPKLLSCLEQSKFPPSETLLSFFNKILQFDPNSFFETNHKNLSVYNELLRYPELQNNTQVHKSCLQGQEELGLKNFIHIRDFATGVKENIILWNKTKNLNQ